MKHIFILLFIVACTNKAPEPVVKQLESPVMENNAHSQMAAMPGMQGQGLEQKHPQAAPAAPEATAPALGSIPKTQDGNIAELHKTRNNLKGKEVSISGKVMKFSPMIMKKNWVHLQDGSGDKKDKNFDLTVTTNETVKVGDIITVKGKLSADKDIGFGYFYQVLIEDAIIVR